MPQSSADRPAPGRHLPSRRFWIWAAPAALWLVFSFWYTNTAGRLTDAEIAAFQEQMLRNGTPAERMERTLRFMAEDDGDQVLMVNLLEMAGGGDAQAEAQAERSMARYMDHMLPEMFKRASHPVLMGGAVFGAMDLMGIEGAEFWSRAGVVRYRSRRDLMDIGLAPVFGDQHDFKVAALDKTIAVPVAAELHPSDLRLLLGLFLIAVAGVLDATLGRRRA